MGFNIPTVETCCCCFPLTSGLIFAGYLKIIASLFFVGISVFCIFIYIAFVPNALGLFSFLVVLTIVLILIDVIITSFLITGALLNKMSYLSLYYRFGFVWGVIIISEGITWIIYEITTSSDGNPWKMYFAVSLLTSVIFLLHVYCVILTKSIIEKIKSTTQTDL